MLLQRELCELRCRIKVLKISLEGEFKHKLHTLDAAVIEMYADTE
jgi:hypothetical protein